MRDILLECETENHYCSYYKKLAVEEISLCEYPHMVHYGNCSIIGIISYCSSGLHHLNNVKLKSLDKEFQIPNNSTSIILLDTLLPGTIPLDTACEVFGELVLFDNIDVDKNIIPTTSKDLKRELNNLIKRSEIDENTLTQILKDMKERFTPAVRAHSFCVVDQPQELVECNLAIRNLKMKISSHCRDSSNVH